MKRPSSVFVHVKRSPAKTLPLKAKADPAEDVDDVHVCAERKGHTVGGVVSLIIRSAAPPVCKQPAAAGTDV